MQVGCHGHKAAGRGKHVWLSCPLVAHPRISLFEPADQFNALSLSPLSACRIAGSAISQLAPIQHSRSSG